MTHLPLAFALLGAIAAGISAWLWLQSARVAISPGWLSAGVMEPVDPAQARAGWMVGVLDAAQKSAALNRRAAVATAIATMRGALSAVLGQLG